MADDLYVRACTLKDAASVYLGKLLNLKARRREVAQSHENLEAALNEYQQARYALEAAIAGRSADDPGPANDQDDADIRIEPEPEF